MKPPYARRGVDYVTKNKIFFIDGGFTLDGLRVNIEVQARDGVLKEPLAPPENTWIPLARRHIPLNLLGQPANFPS
ncbi:MAG: hypothetical protein WCH75_11765 [Candidatus Binatia bacterium]